METILSIIISSTFLSINANCQDLWQEQEVILKTSTGDIYGTLILPGGTDSFPIVLIVAGSGPTNRNGNQPQVRHDAYKKLAQELANDGIATLRFDKRGVGLSRNALKSEAELRADHYIEDVKQWVDLLRKDKRFSQIIVLGHSEGALIGMLAASKANKFISVAGSGVSFDQLIKNQLSPQSEFVKEYAFPILDSLKKGQLVQNINPLFNSLFRASVQPYWISLFRFHPAEEISKLDIPVLIVQGTSDLQITVEDANILAQSNQNSKLVIIENMNHVLRIVPGGIDENLATYTNTEQPVSEELILCIKEFVFSGYK